MRLIARERDAHWYLPSGETYHTVLSADGVTPRPTTLRDARKVGALPSVTSVLGIIAKAGLEAWKLEQAILSALTLPRGRNEPLDVYAKRITTDMDAQVRASAEVGVKIHAACQEYALKRTCTLEADLVPYWEPWKVWFDANVQEVRRVEEVVISRSHGYGGTMDLECWLTGFGWTVVDFKTQKVKKAASGEPRPAFYETWPLQLAAYRRAIGGHVASVENPMGERLASVVIDVERPRPVAVRVWDETAEYWHVFEAALAMWRYMKDYDPRCPDLPRCYVGRREVCSANLKAA